MKGKKKVRKSNIRTAIRIRPPLPREIKNNQILNCVAISQKK